MNKTLKKNFIKNFKYFFKAIKTCALYNKNNYLVFIVIVFFSTK